MTGRLPVLPNDTEGSKDWVHLSRDFRPGGNYRALEWWARPRLRMRQLPFRIRGGVAGSRVQFNGTGDG
ncbi:MAG: hypothetical protein CMO40_00995 [Verrucomicrobiaceae bacterium]|nr:hypothetical protein [Verrucomicrobiaceae bacterium]